MSQKFADFSELRIYCLSCIKSYTSLGQSLLLRPAELKHNKHYVMGTG